MAIEESVEDKIRAFINTFSPDEVLVAKRIMFLLTNKHLINKIKKIYEQPDSSPSDVSIDKK